MKRYPITFQLTAQEFVHLCNAASDLQNTALDIKLLEGALDSLPKEGLDEVIALRKPHIPMGHFPMGQGFPLD